MYRSRRTRLGRRILFVLLLVSVLHPGTGGSCPSWPTRHFLELPGLLREAGMATVITIANDETKSAQRRANALRHIHPDSKKLDVASLEAPPRDEGPNLSALFASKPPERTEKGQESNA